MKQRQSKRIQYIHVLDVCSKFASCLLHRVNGVLSYFSYQPDTVLHCQTTDTRLYASCGVPAYVPAFAGTKCTYAHGKMTRLSWAVQSHKKKTSPADLKSSFIGHAEVCGDDVVRRNLRSNVRHCKLSDHEAAAVDWPVLLSTQTDTYHPYTSHSYHSANHSSFVEVRPLLCHYSQKTQVCV